MKNICIILLELDVASLCLHHILFKGWWKDDGRTKKSSFAQFYLLWVMDLTRHVFFNSIWIDMYFYILGSMIIGFCVGRHHRFKNKKMVKKTYHLYSYWDVCTYLDLHRVVYNDWHKGNIIYCIILRKILSYTFLTFRMFLYLILNILDTSSLISISNSISHTFMNSS